ncbi:MAG: flagellar filament capping protein FliD [Lachnospiraceae bacterium]|nr:flagellar filament capping protein FliD [Lachnospiraceae bacterium]
MTMRLTGMYSGLDTETIIQELVKARSTKVDTVKKDKTKLEWKQEAWNDINTKTKSFFNGKLNDLRFSSAYKKKTTSVSDTSAVSVITGDAAMNGVQKLSVDKLAKAGYLTGDVIKAEEGGVKAETAISDLKLDGYSGDKFDFSKGGSFTITVNGKSTDIELDADATIQTAVKKLNEAGINANFDEKNGRIFLASTQTGEDYDFAITANDNGGFTALSVLGINVYGGSEENSPNAKTYKEYEKLKSLGSELESKLSYSGGKIDYEATMKRLDVESDLYKAIKAGMKSDDDYEAGIDLLRKRCEFAQTVANDYNDAKYYSNGNRIGGSDAQITLNGVSFTSNSNNIEVNGLTFSCISEAADITVTTKDDTDGIYDMIKNFIKEYNDIVKELDKKYNVKFEKGFEPLTDDEKEKMSDKEVEKWEDKIKSMLLRKDSSLGTLFNAMKDTMNKGYEVNGKTMYLSDFGIETLSYFSAADNEKAVLHIDGDPDDDQTKGNADKLKSMIATDPEAVIEFFTQLTRGVYSKLDGISASTTNTSKGSFYEDKQYRRDLANYESKIKEAEDKLAKYEDKYYSKFSKMEVALSKLESSTSSITSMLGQ